jgi:hypothetical protein
LGRYGRAPAPSGAGGGGPEPINSTAVPRAAAAENWPRWKSKFTIGSRRAINPAMDGTVINKSRRRENEKSSLSRSNHPRAAWAESAGRTAIPMATPKIPIGNWIRRRA